MTTYFSAMLIAAMNKLNLSIRDVAADCGVTYEHIRKIVAGTTFPSKDLTKRICKVAEIEIEAVNRMMAEDRLRLKYGFSPEFNKRVDERLSDICCIWEALDDRGRRDLYGFCQLLIKLSSEQPIEADNGLTYFIESGSTLLVKIGSTTNLSRRFESLSRGRREKLKLLATIPGGYNTEKNLHQRFYEYRKVGEWFENTGKLAEFIRTLTPHTPQTP